MLHAHSGSGGDSAPSNPQADGTATTWNVVSHCSLISEVHFPLFESEFGHLTLAKGMLRDLKQIET